MITLKSISIRDFMSISELDLDFEDNTIVAISGANGSGKSSLLYAIALCISGYRKGESYRNYVKADCEVATVKLSAVLDSDPIFYDIEISGNLKKQSQPLKRKVDYKGQTYLNSDYTQFMKEHDLEYIEQIMFMFQGSTDIIDAKPTERASILKKLFRFDFSSEIDVLKSKQERDKEVNLETNAIISELKSKTYETLPLLRETIPAAIQEWTQELQTTQQLLQQTDSIDSSALDENTRKIAAVQTNISTVKLRVAQIENDITSSEQLRDRVSQSISRKDEDHITSKIESLQRKLEEHKQNYQTAKAVVDGLTNTLNIRNFELKQLLKQIEIASTGVCHACGQPVEKSHLDSLEEKKNNTLLAIEEIKNNIASLNFDAEDNTSKQIEKEIKSHKDLIGELTKEKDTLKHYTSHIKDAEELLSEKKDSLQKLKDEESVLLKEKEHLQDILPILQQRKALTNRKEELESFLQEARDRSIKNSERRYTNDIIQRDKKERDEKLSALTEKSNNIMLGLNNIKAEIDIFENKFPAYLILQATQQLEDYINEIIQRVFPYCKVYLMLAGKGVNFFYTSESSEDELLPVSMASGAQRSILSLAWKIALARLWGCSCIGLDEVDAACSAESAAIIYKFIASLECFDQIIFISHRPESLQAAKEVNSNVIPYIVDRGGYELAL